MDVLPAPPLLLPVQPVLSLMSSTLKENALKVIMTIAPYTALTQSVVRSASQPFDLKTEHV